MNLKTLSNLSRNLKKVNQKLVENLFAKEIQNKSSEITSLVRNRWKSGKRPNGSIIGSYKSFSYKEYKIGKNPSASGNVDLIDTGSLNTGLVVNTLVGGNFTIFSTDEKAIMIASKYGLDVYGLTDSESVKVVLEASENTIKAINKFIYNGVL